MYQTQTSFIEIGLLSGDLDLKEKVKMNILDLKRKSKDQNVIMMRLYNLD